jgi:hypothetical protein
MNFLNMFSDEAPISNNGYRSSLYTDPSIMQGVKFLNYEKDITDNLTGNLRLISQTDGSDLSSGQVINGKIYEGMAAGENAPEKEFETEVMEKIKDQDIEYLKMSYSFVSSLYNNLLQNFGKDYKGGLADNKLGTDEKLIPGQRQQIIKSIESIQAALGIINVQISDVIKQRSKTNIKAYYVIMDEIRDTKYKIIDINNRIQELTRVVDPTSAVAEREETHILSKQRYYMYIFWFILTAVVMYVMIANMIDPNSSFSILIVCLIILVCIFGFIMYNYITGLWYNGIINGIKNFRIPKIGNVINFDPLVSIKYTS